MFLRMLDKGSVEYRNSSHKILTAEISRVRRSNPEPWSELNGSGIPSPWELSEEDIKEDPTEREAAVDRQDSSLEDTELDLDELKRSFEEDLKVEPESTEAEPEWEVESLLDHRWEDAIC